MIKRTFTISNPSGLHIRPASVLAGGLGQFHADAVIHFENRTFNGKSAISIMTANIKTGATIELVCDGHDEQQAMDAAAQLIESGLGE